MQTRCGSRLGLANSCHLCSLNANLGRFLEILMLAPPSPANFFTFVSALVFASAVSKHLIGHCHTTGRPNSSNIPFDFKYCAINCQFAHYTVDGINSATLWCSAALLVVTHTNTAWYLVYQAPNGVERTLGLRRFGVLADSLFFDTSETNCPRQTWIPHRSSGHINTPE